MVGGSGQPLSVETADGALLTAWVSGNGPALLMVHGSIADHTTFDGFVDVLRRHLTTFAMDRRGFGASPEAGEPYSVDREFDDVAAVVDAIAAHVGAPVALFGHSFGASCAMGAAARTENLSHLILYEPSLGLTYPPGSIDAIEALLDSGDTEGAIVAVFTDILEMSEDEIAAFRGSPLWPLRLATAPTIPRECRVEEDWVFQPGQFDGIKAPTLMLAGSESTASLAKATERATAAIPHARVHILEGHGHFAHKADPEMVSAVIRAFLAE